ncbi:RagB/SusD family nutrient uptake outer membrane protein [Chryseolinea soli]|uniref:RagB/SusD family nutrient uptake outer membrane protein n=1 Tax=Chryseolinea soli TaxID=2321403 RepID=A0A385SLX3_9BACT|nr:RagB/SusD family nutrient uptake outer membrane protein [Chryseolinea soli]AYB31964.1 RagB/SusD family nutrient uptake outer membrane protein [Chryseolinea soli]
MKKIYKLSYGFILVAVCLMTISCEDWLDVNPSTQLDRDGLFSTEAGYRDAITGTYSQMTSTSLYGREMTFGALDVLAGYYNPTQSGTTTYYKFFYQYPYKLDNAGKDDACVAVVDKMWSDTYGAIANLNSLLETIDDNKTVFSGENYQVMKGEAIGLRAFLHFDLLRMFGPSYTVDPAANAIPYVDTLSSRVSPLLTVEQAADRIISELQRSLMLMEKDPIISGEQPSIVLSSAVSTETMPGYHNRKYRFNYYAAAAALARVYLWKGDKVNALKYAKQVIAVQASRFPWVEDANLTSISTANATNKDRTFTTEHIFGLNVRALEGTVPLHFSPVGMGSSTGLLLYSSRYIKNQIYESNTLDPRNQYLFLADGSNFFPTKLYQDAVTSSWFKNQVPLIRISEMYYIAAESEPNVEDGLVWLNTVRQVRKLSVLDAATVPNAETLDVEIQKEFQKEFICEGQLWFYYKRKNLESLPYSFSFSDTKLYVFDLPADETAFGGR